MIMMWDIGNFNMWSLQDFYLMFTIPGDSFENLCILAHEITKFPNRFLYCQSTTSIIMYLHIF